MSCGWFSGGCNSYSIYRYKCDWRWRILLEMENPESSLECSCSWCAPSPASGQPYSETTKRIVLKLIYIPTRSLLRTNGSLHSPSSNNLALLRARLASPSPSSTLPLRAFSFGTRRLPRLLPTCQCYADAIAACHQERSWTPWTGT